MKGLSGENNADLRQRCVPTAMIGEPMQPPGRAVEESDLSLDFDDASATVTVPGPARISFPRRLYL